MTFALIVTVVALVAIYTVRCMVRPWTACPRCNGAGEHRRMLGGRLPCHHCHGSGKRRRFAYRIIGRVLRIYLAAQKAHAAEKARIAR